MKTSEQFLADHKLGLLLIGEPWSGKSRLALQFPDPWICDADNNLSRHVDLMRGKRFWYDRIDIDNDGKLIPEERRWLRFLEVTTAAANDPGPQYLVFDSLTSVGNILERYVISQGSSSKDLVIGGVKSMTLQLWNPYKDLLRKLVVEVRACSKPCIFICHQKVDKDEVSGVLLQKPMVGGQLADYFGALFTDVWHCVAEPGMPTKDNPQGVNYIVETVPQPRMAQLGTSLGLPPKFKFDWSLVAEKLGGVK